MCSGLDPGCSAGASSAAWVSSAAGSCDTGRASQESLGGGSSPGDTQVCVVEYLLARIVSNHCEFFTGSPAIEIPQKKTWKEHTTQNTNKQHPHTKKITTKNTQKMLFFYQTEKPRKTHVENEFAFPLQPPTTRRGSRSALGTGGHSVSSAGLAWSSCGDKAAPLSVGWVGPFYLFQLQFIVTILLFNYFLCNLSFIFLIALLL